MADNQTKDILKQLKQPSFYTGFKNKTVSIERLCFPAVTFEDNTSDVNLAKNRKKNEVIHKIKSVDGLYIIAKADNGATLELLIPCSKTVGVAVMEQQLWFKYGVNFKLAFNNDGICYDIIANGNKPLEELSRIADGEINTSESSILRFQLADQNKPDNTVFNTLDSMIIVKYDKQSKTYSCFAKDNAISEIAKQALLDNIKDKSFKSLEALTIVNDPDFIILKKKDDYLYFKLV